MTDEGSVQDMEVEWQEFLVKFRANHEHMKQRIRKVNQLIGFFRIWILFSC
jgi:hypothetical protein